MGNSMPTSRKTFLKKVERIQTNYEKHTYASDDSASDGFTDFLHDKAKQAEIKNSPEKK